MSRLTDAEADLLSRRLREVMDANGLTQKALQHELGVDQAAISRALHRKLRLQGVAYERLLNYVNMRNNEPLPEAAVAAFKRYVDVGGDMVVLCDAIDLLGDAQVKARRGR